MHLPSTSLLILIALATASPLPNTPSPNINAIALRRDVGGVAGGSGASDSGVPTIVRRSPGDNDDFFASTSGDNGDSNNFFASTSGSDGGGSKKVRRDDSDDDRYGFGPGSDGWRKRS